MRNKLITVWIVVAPIVGTWWQETVLQPQKYPSLYKRIPIDPVSIMISYMTSMWFTGLILAICFLAVFVWRHK